MLFLTFFNCCIIFYITVLTELVSSMHSLREKHSIKSHCPCTNKQNLLNKLPATNGVSQVLLTVPHPGLGHFVLKKSHRVSIRFLCLFVLTPNVLFAGGCNK